MEDELNKISSLNRMSPRLVIQQLISFGLVVVTALMIWKTLMIVSLEVKVVLSLYCHNL
jgi:sensor domain CHASE-containing protein